MSKVRIAGMIVSKNGLTLFMSDGASSILPSTSYRTQSVLDILIQTPQDQYPVEIDLDDFSLDTMSAKNRPVIEINKATSVVSLVTNGHKIEATGRFEEHLREAVLNDAPGLKRFMERIGTIKRKHSVEELLNFMKHGDLPIADDGCIIGYKILRNATVHADDYFVDPHTQKVRQRVGSLVYMPASKVDDNRRQLCSTGLHVCSIHYFRHYPGDAVCLVKVRPEDVIAVPENETSKMRVCAYQICAVIPHEHMTTMRNGTSLDKIERAALLLARVIAGDHPSMLERVKVGGDGEHSVELIDRKYEPMPVKAKVRKKVVARSKVETKIDIKKIKAKIVAVNKKAHNPVIAYKEKLREAKKLWKKGKGLSIRAIAGQLHMSRDALSRDLS
jgi:hypothetical protein